MHFIVTQLGLVFGAPGGHLDRASVSAPCACGSRGLGRRRGPLEPHPLSLPPAPGCPARSLDRKRTLSSETASGSSPEKHGSRHRPRPSVGRCAVWATAPRQRRGRGGSDGGWKAGSPRASRCCWRWARIPCRKHFLLRVLLFGFRLEVLKKTWNSIPERGKKRSPKRLQAGTKQVALGRQRPSTRGEGLLRRCRTRTRTRTIPGSQGPPPNRPCPLGCQGLPRRRRERLKAKTQLGSETRLSHSSHPLKCPVAALENCCSKVYFSAQE